MNFRFVQLRAISVYRKLVGSKREIWRPNHPRKSFRLVNKVSMLDLQSLLLDQEHELLSKETIFLLRFSKVLIFNS